MKQNIIKIKHTDENMTPVMYKIFAELPEDCENIIQFEKGEYNFHRAGSINKMLYVSARKACPIDVIFDIVGKKNLTIDGNGSHFVFRDRVNPFYVANCENIKFKNFTMEYSFVRYAYADIIDVRDDGFLINIDENVFDYRINDDHNIEFICGEEAISTKYRKISTKSLSISGSTIVFTHVGEYEGRLNPAAKHLFVDAIKQGENIFMKYRENNENLLPEEFEVGHTLCLGYDNDREAQAFACEYCKNIELENVSIYRNAGMGLVFDLCENVTVNNFSMAIKEGRREYYSSTADAIFLTNCSGDFKLLNSTICDTYDDAINIHGFYLKVDEVLDGNRLRLVHGHDAHSVVPYFVGDTVHFSGGENLDELGSAVVSGITFDEDRQTNIILTLDSTEGIEAGMIIENRDRMPNVLIENNTIINCPHMRLSAPNMIIRNNKLNLNNGDVYIDDLATFWQESGAVETAEVIGNTFGESNTANVIISSCRPATSNHIHNKVILKGNTFTMSRDKAIMAKVVYELIEEDNKFGI